MNHINQPEFRKYEAGVASIEGTVKPVAYGSLSLAPGRIESSSDSSVQAT